MAVASLASGAALSAADHDLAAWVIALMVGGALLLLLLVMLMLDLHAFLGWIAQRPFEEKPPTPFLPKAAAPDATPTAVRRP